MSNDYNEYDNDHDDDSYENHDDDSNGDYDDGHSDSRDDSDFGKPISVDMPSISTYTVMQPANTPYVNDGYQFSITNGAITGIIEIENGYAKQERIEFGETW